MDQFARPADAEVSRAMPRYFFCISNGKPYMDLMGEELFDDRHAWRTATRLARDIESALEPDGGS